MKLAFLGDISLNDLYNVFFVQGQHPFLNAHSFLNDYDFVVGNLECMSEGDEGENTLKAPRLKTKTETLAFLNEIGVNIALLAHNHAYDNLLDGFNKTQAFLDNNGIRHLGAGTTKESACQPLILTNGTHRICLLNYVTPDTNPKLPDNCHIHLNWYDPNQIIADIRKYKSDCDFLILLFHWGGRVERGRFPDWNQPSEARSFIDAGADLIVGGHTHTVQPYEIYKNKYIFYSLGNFCFSHFFDDEFNRNSSPFWNCHSLIPTIDIHDKQLSVSVFESNVDKYGNNIISPAKMSILNSMYRVVFSSKLVWKIYFLLLKKVQPWCHFVFTNEMTTKAKLKRITRKINKIIR